MDPWNRSIEDEEASQAYMSFRFGRIFLKVCYFRKDGEIILKRLQLIRMSGPRRGAYRFFLLLVKHQFCLIIAFLIFFSFFV